MRPGHFIHRIPRAEAPSFKTGRMRVPLSTVTTSGIQMKTMKRRWTFRAYPTDAQAEHLALTFGCCRLAYNGMLAARTAAFQRGERMGFAQSDKHLTAVKRDPDMAFLNDVSSVPLQQALRHLQTAFVNFFAKRAAYPTFKKKGRSRDSAMYTRSAFRFDLATQRLSLAKLGSLALRISRPVPSDPSTVTVIRHPSGRFYVSMVLDVEPRKRVTTGQSIGVDFGVNRLAMLSNGETIPNPKHLGCRLHLLQRAHRRLSRKQKGSRRWRRQTQRVARLYEKIADARRDSLHKFSTNLARRFDTIYVEDLNVRGLTKNHSLARALSDTSIGTALRLLQEKAETVVKIDRFYPSSKTCSACGYLADTLPLSVRQWTCPHCETVLDRDLNAAKNILAVGQTVTARGASVRARRATARRAGRQRSANHLERTLHVAS